MTNQETITLRYFDARGRAQFLRAYMSARGVEFEDERVPLEPDFASWLAIRSDRSVTGPLHRLPVLHYGDRLIPETLVIAHFLHRTFGDEAALSEADNLRHDVILSSAYVDLMYSMGTLLWADLLFKGVELPTLAKSVLERFGRTLAALDQTLTEWRWTETMRERPVTLADCLLWEELDQATLVFGPYLTLDDKPALARFHAEHPARAAFEALLAERPCQITGRPGEADAIAKIHALLKDSASG
jgi:hypothetical protein